MSKAAKRNFPIIGVVLLVIVGIGVAVNFVFSPFEEQVLRYPTTVGSYQNSGNYQIDPETIITSIDRGKTDVFRPAPESPHTYASVSEGPVPPWHQAEYLKITRALHQFVWGEPLDGWNLYRMSFDADCRLGLQGFGIGDFVSYKAIWIGGRLNYTAREIVIHPLDNEVTWGGGTTFPHPIFGWKKIDLGTLRVSAEDALRIAEENGGRVARLSAQDQCTIYAVMLPNSGYDGWTVGYSGMGDRRIFRIRINPYSGNIE